MPIVCKNMIASIPSYREIRDRPKIASTSTILLKRAPRSNVLSLKLHEQKKETSALVPVRFRAPQKLTRRQRKKENWLQWNEAIANGERRPKKFYGEWDQLPDLVLEQIYNYLPLRDKMSCASVCYHWFRVAKYHSIWHYFIVNDNFMTRSKYNYMGGCYENVLDPTKASMYMNKLIKKARSLIFLPKRNLYILCTFQAMMIRWCKLYGELANIKTFTYVFPCNFWSPQNGEEICGTGGALLEDLKSVLLNLTGLEQFELKDLQLDDIDAAHILDEVSTLCNQRLKTLKMINISRQPYQMLSVPSFSNLKNLYISPHNIGPEMVLCFGKMQALQNVVLVVNPFTESQNLSVEPDIWKMCRKKNPKLRVHLLTEGKRAKEVVFQEGAPVRSIVYDSPHFKTTDLTISAVEENYLFDLECLAYCQLPRYHMPKSFQDRPDKSIIHLLKHCPNIHTLMIRERISSATVLLMAFTGKSLRFLHVRRNAIVLKCDWKKKSYWDSHFYDWLKGSSRSYEDMEREVSKLFGFRWYALTDKEFKRTTVNLTSIHSSIRKC